MSPTNANINTPVVRSRLTKNRRNKSGGILKGTPLNLPSSSGPVSSTPSIQTNQRGASSSSMFPPPTLPIKETLVSPCNYRNYEMLTSSPFHIPNSQAPIPGREVYWDLDTPQSRKYREALTKEFEESDSPVAKLREVTPKMRMVPKTRFEPATSTEVVRKGEEAMQELLEMCREKEEETVEEKVITVENVEPVCQLKMEHLSMELKLETKEDEFDMFADDIDLGDTMDFSVEQGDVNVDVDAVENNSQIHDKAIDDLFDDDDESFLLQATQAAENDQVVNHLKNVPPVDAPKPLIKVEKELSRTAVKKEVVVTVKAETKMSNPVISRVQAQSAKVDTGFGSEDDSFDELLSQMVDPVEEDDTPASPVLRKKRKCFDLCVTSQPYQALPLPLTEQNRKVTKGPGRQLAKDVISSGGQAKKVTGAVQQRQDGGTFRKFNSFDSQEEKKTFPRIKSDPYIGSTSVSSNQLQPGRVGNIASMVVPPSKPMTRLACSKDEINRKKKEAMARRQMSQSQVKR